MRKSLFYRSEIVLPGYSSNCVVILKHQLPSHKLQMHVCCSNLLFDLPFFKNLLKMEAPQKY
jgi:hypothetical protein